MSDATTELSQRMLDRADADGLPPDHELRRLAAALDEKAAGLYSTPPTATVGQMMGAWARARRAWCAYTGERLI